MIKFGKSLVKYEQKIIEFERKRTILYLSKFNKKKIWVNTWIGKENELISGIVKTILVGNAESNESYLLDCKFSFDEENYILFKDIFAISFKPFSLDDNNFAAMFNSSIYGNESELEGDIIFSLTDLIPQDFSSKTPIELGNEFSGEFRSFNTRYYELISKSMRD